VGKSSLFNILTGHKIAIVSDIENTTRDVIEYHLKDHERSLEYVLADSGGLTSGTDDMILRDVRTRVEGSIARSDIVLFVVEYDKLTVVDEAIARMLRKSGKPVILLANKADNPDRVQEAYGITRLGFKDFIITSSAHSLGKEAVLIKIQEIYQALGYSSPIIEDDPHMLKVAIIGRPNVGKSSLLNALVGEQRSVVADLAGTTRDSTDTLIEWKGKPLTLIDTAGIRRAGKV
jgi:GTP-binding protein